MDDQTPELSEQDIQKKFSRSMREPPYSFDRVLQHSDEIHNTIQQGATDAQVDQFVRMSGFSVSQKISSASARISNALHDPNQRKGLIIASAAVTAAALSVAYLAKRWRDRKAEKAAEATAAAAPATNNKEKPSPDKSASPQEKSSFLRNATGLAAGIGLIDKNTAAAATNALDGKWTEAAQAGAKAAAARNGQEEALGAILNMANGIAAKGR